MNIIIHGPGRSGTTLFNKMFSYHPDFVWLSSWQNRFPKQAWLGVFNTIYQKQMLGVDWSSVKNIPKPAEAYGFWNHYFKPFSSEARLDVEKTEDCINFITSLKQISGKKNFVTKLTGEARKEILDQVFNKNYLVLWIERDPRVVVSSYIKQKWFYKNKPEEFAKLSMTDKIEFYANFYKQNFEGAKPLNRKLLRYEDLCDDPVMFFESLLKDLNLPFHKKHRKIIEQWELKVVDWKSYSKKYSEEEKTLFNQLLKDEMVYLNYEV
ncbi:sulfotransferase [Psychroflexus tropicus]|uniref:sulfotransferase n=1 Tax=Psychroflexus tropicus TaxID=197345 RepID=UPI00037CEA1C|nr:sulfotransferase [Psychroflexus tropicus]